jgi:hypothetical protein
MSFSHVWRRSLVVAVVLVVCAVPMYANHAWGNYHWARTANPFTLKVNDNVTAVWEPYLAEAQTDWNRSTVLDLNVIWQNPLSSQRKCSSVTGQIEVCNLKYGQNGWLGIAGISISGSHITKGYTKLNDTYFSMAQYNTPAWRRMVTCQEIGHDFGLAHQDETFDNVNLGSCMDYTNDPDGGAGGASSNDASNEHPNQHDYDQIQSIYSHTDGTTTIGAVIDSMAKAASRPPTMVEILDATDDDWGTAVGYDGHGRPNRFARPTGMNADGELEFDLTHVTWAIDAPGSRAGHGH